MKRRSSPAKSQQSGQFRIIGGLHRGRKLSFPAIENLRPTPDRVRETLFNWLFDDVINARCLDLCAGSGALGLEALSRGAQHCMFIETNGDASKSISEHLQTLEAIGSRVQLGQLPQSLHQLANEEAFNLIFLDPPYKLDIINDCIALLDELDLIASDAWLYIENASNDPAPILADSDRSIFRLHREKSFGQVRASLFQYQQLS